MDFLLPYMTNRNRDDNFQESDDSQARSENADTVAMENMAYSKVVSDNDVYEGEVIRNIDTCEEIISQTEGAAELDISPLIRSSCSTKQRKTTKKLDVSTLIQQSIVQRERRAKERAIERKKIEDTKSANDPLYHFFMSMYQATKNMPPIKQHYIRGKVFEVVSQTEASLLGIHNPTSEELQPPRNYEATRAIHPSTHPSYSSEASNTSLTLLQNAVDIHSTTAAGSFDQLMNNNNDFCN